MSPYFVSKYTIGWITTLRFKGTEILGKRTIHRFDRYFKGNAFSLHSKGKPPGGSLERLDDTCPHETLHDLCQVVFRCADFTREFLALDVFVRTPCESRKRMDSNQGSIRKVNNIIHRHCGTTILFIKHAVKT